MSTKTPTDKLLDLWAENKSNHSKEYVVELLKQIELFATESNTLSRMWIREELEKIISKQTKTTQMSSFKELSNENITLQKKVIAALKAQISESPMALNQPYLGDDFFGDSSDDGIVALDNKGLYYGNLDEEDIDNITHQPYELYDIDTLLAVLENVETFGVTIWGE